MARIDSLLAELDERHIAQRVALRHDEARMRFPLQRNTVDTFDEFSRLISDYCSSHLQAVLNGAVLPRVEAASEAKELLEQEYRRKGGDIVAAFNDAHDGTNGGMRVVLDVIAEGLKARSVERHIRDVFDRHVAPNDWDTKVEIIRQFIAQCGANMASSIRPDQPERYAHDYRELIESYVESLRRTSSVFRRL